MELPVGTLLRPNVAFVSRDLVLASQEPVDLTELNCLRSLLTTSPNPELVEKQQSWNTRHQCLECRDVPVSSSSYRKSAALLGLRITFQNEVTGLKI